MGEPCPAPLRVAMRSPLPFPCVPDRPSKILLVQVGTLSLSHPSFGVPVLFIYLFIYYTTQELAHCCCGGGSDGDCELTADGCTAVRLTAGGWLRRTATARFAFAPRRCD